MPHYKHLSNEERSILGHYRSRRLSMREIARRMNRNVSTISRELKRNKYVNGRYAAYHAQSYYRGRLRRSRSGSNFSSKQWQQVFKLLAKQFSPEQISGLLKLEGSLNISHETIYKYIWIDKRYGGELYKELRGSGKKRRERYDADL